MKVALVNITNGRLSGGVRKYLHQMVPLLSADPRVDDLQVFSPEVTPALREMGV